MNLFDLYIVKYKRRFYRMIMKLFKNVDLDIARKIYSYYYKKHLVLASKVIDDGLF